MNPSQQQQQATYQPLKRSSYGASSLSLSSLALSSNNSLASWGSVASRQAYGDLSKLQTQVPPPARLSVLPQQEEDDGIDSWGYFVDTVDRQDSQPSNALGW